mmetsp:Transcript_19272/g.31038  ORF Transcript_19272/g.31038 Transcript_19272/m.31038 type:complete len:235 (-) Transcript_19272:162-866(-)
MTPRSNRMLHSDHGIACKSSINRGFPVEKDGTSFLSKPMMIPAKDRLQGQDVSSSQCSVEIQDEKSSDGVSVLTHPRPSSIGPVLRPKLVSKNHSKLVGGESERIRSRYLCRLGITKIPSISTGRKNGSNKQSILKRRPKQQSGRENSNNSKGNVLFDQQIVTKVFLIPSRDNYPLDLQNAMWMRGEEYDYTVMKNMIEFMAEGCKQDQVLEENDFIFLPSQNILIHPAHLLDW